MFHRRKYKKFNNSVIQSYKAMGGEFIFKGYPQDKFNNDEVIKLFDLAAKEVIRIENKFTDFKDSELNNINKLAGVSPCLVDDEMYSLINSLFKTIYSKITARDKF